MAIHIQFPNAPAAGAAADAVAAKGQFVHSTLAMGHQPPAGAPHENSLVDNLFGFTRHAFAPTDLGTGGGLFHGGA